MEATKVIRQLAKMRHSSQSHQKSADGFLVEIRDDFIVKVVQPYHLQRTQLLVDTGRFSAASLLSSLKISCYHCLMLLLFGNCWFLLHVDFIL